MRRVSLFCVLCISGIASAQVIDENYGRDTPNSAGTSASSSIEFNDDELQRASQRIVDRLESMKGCNSNKDLFVLGESNGRQARFYAITGAAKTAEKILDITKRRNSWRVYGRATDELIARRLMTSAKREYVAQQRLKFG